MLASLNHNFSDAFRWIRNKETDPFDLVEIVSDDPQETPLRFPTNGLRHGRLLIATARRCPRKLLND